MKNNSKASAALFVGFLGVLSSSVSATEILAIGAPVAKPPYQVNAVFVPQIKIHPNQTPFVHRVDYCEDLCGITYNQCNAVGGGNCENKYRVCMNAC
ncbi:hypothetical protein X739_33480 [Mesorhizobium sp. LNHC220B00]|nr:hypothetical protein [Mesorhizobium sp. LNHC220B00]ESY76876.1 hypothetical protein X739_33480 [Mesorhizobium sp. LNHC220B00]